MKLLAAAGCCAAVFGMSFAQSQNAAGSAEGALEEIVVAGEYPGPGLWKISKVGDDGHVLWIFGTLGEVPSAIKWRSRQVEEIVAVSQEVIHADVVSITFEEKVGIFTALRLIPSVLRARKNPDDKKLQDVLPAETYAHWQVLKARYIGRDGGIESWRPMFAAEYLKDKATRELQPLFGQGSWWRVDSLVREFKLRVTSPVVAVKIPNAQMRASIKNFSKTSMQDVECLDTTLKFIDALGDEHAVHARATAWAKGNLAALRELPPIPTPDEPCTTALLGSQAVQDLHLEGLDNLQSRGVDKWLEAIDQAFANNHSTLAFLPIDEVLKQDGRLAMLREKGYRVEEPI